MNKKIRNIVLIVAMCAFTIFGIYVNRDYDQYSSNIPFVSWAIETENYSQALEKLEKIAHPDVCMTAATAYCLYKTEGKSAAIRLVTDYLANKDLKENDRAFLSSFIDDMSKDNISTFILEYKKSDGTFRKNIEYNVRYN